MSTNMITSEDTLTIEAYLSDNGYADLEAWGLDSDYLYDDEQDEWFDGIAVAGYTHPFGNMVDLRVQLLIAIEAATHEAWSYLA